MKALVWDNKGLVMVYKRLDGTGARFNWPKDSIQVRNIAKEQLIKLMDGFSVDPPKGFSAVTAREFY